VRWSVKSLKAGTKTANLRIMERGIKRNSKLESRYPSNKKIQMLKLRKRKKLLL